MRRLFRKFESRVGETFLFFSLFITPRDKHHYVYCSTSTHRRRQLDIHYSNADALRSTIALTWSFRQDSLTRC